MSRRLVMRVGVLLQLVALIALVVLAVWWFSALHPRTEQAAPPEPTVAAFLNTVRDSLATEQAQGAPKH